MGNFLVSFWQINTSSVTYKAPVHNSNYVCDWYALLKINFSNFSVYVYKYKIKFGLWCWPLKNLEDNLREMSLERNQLLFAVASTCICWCYQGFCAACERVKISAVYLLSYRLNALWMNLICGISVPLTTPSIIILCCISVIYDWRNIWL